MAFRFGHALTRMFTRPAKAGAVRRFDATASGRRGFGMGTFHRINSEVAGAGATVRARARYIANNNPWLSQAVANWTGALVGPGITPTPKHPDAATRKALTTAWNLWTEEADADGRTDFNGMQADIARGLVIDGEAFLQVITTEEGPRLRLLPPELVDESMTRELSGGAVIVQGVEFDAEGRRGAYHTRLKLSDVGLLEKVSESGEIKSTTRGEAAESYKLETYGTVYSMSRPSLVNDDLGAFRDWGATTGRMAAETEANLLLKLLLSNPVMGEDGLALFHATHGNLAAAAALSVATLDAARKAMRGMKALDKKTPINATPKFLVVGPEQETTAEQVLASIYAATVADVNPFCGKLTLLVEPRITDDRFYIFADPAVLPVLEYALPPCRGPTCRPSTSL